MAGVLPVVLAGLVAPVQADDTAEAYDGRLDVLFIGAHPDDEAGGLSTYGQWRENHDIASGVITVTRGEGGGNAVGPEEGPPLGLLREDEERRAVGKAGITDVHNLDEVDFFYTVSQPLSREVWGYQDTLAKVVRVVRETKPAVIVTMDPAPSPGNHGHHQEAARLAIEAYEAAGDPTRFPDQDVDPWQPRRLFVSGAEAVEGGDPTGPTCESTFEPVDPAVDSYGVWSGRTAENGDTWAQIEREAMQTYASQGWAGIPDAPTDPEQLECDRFTQIDSRVPYPIAGTPESAAPDAMLQGARVRTPGGFPLDTRFWLEVEDGDGQPSGVVLPGEPFQVTAQVAGRVARDADVELDVPDGWKVEADSSSRVFTVTPAEDAMPGTRVRLLGTLSGDGMTGTTSEAVAVASSVEAVPELLPQVADYEQWTQDVGVPQLSGRVLPVRTLASGGDTTLDVALTNNDDEPHAGSVTLELPDGFAADAKTKPYDAIPAGGSGRVTFTVTNTDASLPTSNEGGVDGDYAYRIATNVEGDSNVSVTQAALELVPTTTIPEVSTAPTVDGAEDTGEYDGPDLDFSRLWEGEECDNQADCSATGRISWHDDVLYVVAHVADDKLGSVLDPADCKRHWRTDSVEIALDPRGTSENTSTTFKTAILPTTTDKAPCFERDADNHQGPGEQTAPGMEVASTVHEPYDGYTVEAKIDLADLPAAVDPERLGLNVFVYDSDTDDKTGQTRIGWSTWGGVQGDPYRWGLATMPGYQPPPDRPTTPKDPVVPSDAAASVGSPQSILQSAATGIPLAGGPEAPLSDTGGLAGPVRLDGGEARGQVLTTGPGTAHVFSWHPDEGVVLDSTELEFTAAGRQRFAITAEPGAVVAVAFEADEGGTHSTAAPVR